MSDTAVSTDPGTVAPPEDRPVYVGVTANKGVGLWGILCLIATESLLFAYLLFSYYYTASQLGPSWSPEPHPDLKLALPNTVVLLASSVAVWWAEGGARRDQRGRQIAGLLIAAVLGIVFVSVQWLEWRAKSYTIQSGPYGSIYFVTTGFHMVHVLVGLVGLLLVTGWSMAGLLNSKRRAPISFASYYWHFVDGVWLAVFFTYYVSPYLWGRS